MFPPIRPAILVAGTLSGVPVVGAVTIDLNFDYDSSGFFDATARATVSAAADFYSDMLTDDLAPITSDPVALNNYEISFVDPSGNEFVQLPYSNFAADSVRIYFGAQDLGSGLGLGGPGGVSISGSEPFKAAASTRGQDFGNGNETAPWGGTITINSREFLSGSLKFWNLNHEADPLSYHQDLYSTALHEIGHVLGVGTSSSFMDQVNQSTHTFHGARSALFNGGEPIPLTLAHDHPDLASETEFHPYVAAPPETSVQVSAFLASRNRGVRHHLTLLDTAIIDDIGWDVNYLTAIPEPGTGVTTLVSLALLAMRRRRA